ncbi:PLP-dependent aminotransferase family protein [Pseudomonas atagonensis]|uniref:aminotransferase-like domain-containing protein n=1 Tax=Pseudomonas atagonensis TaxID=2609964 RepID=UPI00140977B2|nr:PLP-dependent aminotransferase family protein [Pseudomonas atagonensis]
MTVKPSIAMVSILRDGLASGVGVKYKRLADAVEKAINAGVIESGCKLPPHRLLADSLGVTIGTISRAYGELERVGMVVARVGDGTYVRQRGMERPRDKGFRNVSDEPPSCFDMSRNQPIPGQATEFMRQSLQDLASDSHVLQQLAGYTREGGLARHRVAGAVWLRHENFVPHADQVLCVNGGQHGLLCAMMGLLKAGDTVVTEHLSYPGLIGVARQLGIKLIGAAMDDEGLLPSALEDICRQHRVSALYCTPTIQNPTAAVMSLQRREAIAHIGRQHNLLIFEDEAHAVLDRQRPLPLSYFAPERSVLIGSLSKAVSAGLRVGYLHAPQTLIGRIGSAIRGTCWMANPLSMEVASLWIENGMAGRLLDEQISEIGRRKALVAGALQGLNYKTHTYSPHFWVEVPAAWRASQIAAELKENNYLVATAEAFAVGHTAVPQFVRVSVCNSVGDDQLLLRGFEALNRALTETV